MGGEAPATARALVARPIAGTPDNGNPSASHHCDCTEGFQQWCRFLLLRYQPHKPNRVRWWGPLPLARRSATSSGAMPVRGVHAAFASAIPETAIERPEDRSGR